VDEEPIAEESIDEHVTQGDWLSTARCLTRFVVQQLGEGATVAWSEVESTADTDGDGRLSFREAQYSIQRLAPRFNLCTGSWDCACSCWTADVWAWCLECRELVSENREMVLVACCL